MMSIIKLWLERYALKTGPLRPPTKFRCQSAVDADSALEIPLPIDSKNCIQNVDILRVFGAGGTLSDTKPRFPLSAADFERPRRSEAVKNPARWQRRQRRLERAARSRPERSIVHRSQWLHSCG